MGAIKWAVIIAAGGLVAYFFYKKLKSFNPLSGLAGLANVPLQLGTDAAQAAVKTGQAAMSAGGAIAQSFTLPAKIIDLGLSGIHL